MSFEERWRDGAVMIAWIGFVALAGAFVGLAAGGALFFVLELVWHREDWAEIESRNFYRSILAGLLIFGPVFLSQIRNVFADHSSDRR